MFNVHKFYENPDNLKIFVYNKGKKYGLDFEGRRIVTSFLHHSIFERTELEDVRSVGKKILESLECEKVTIETLGGDVVETYEKEQKEEKS